jgi:hypothetical protein
MRSVALVVALLAGCRGAPPALETVRYLRLTPRGAVPECRFRLEAGAVTSVTGALEVAARYDAAGVLLGAEARVGAGEPVRVEASGGRARVSRPKQEAQDFEVPPGVIVTSAPDWTDTFLICRRWDRGRGGRQDFPGLWIHPVQPAQRLTFTAERTGADVLDGLPLDRLLVRLRGNSPYAAWVDPAGRMIKLVSLPFREGSTLLVLEGFEESSQALRPE